MSFRLVPGSSFRGSGRAAYPLPIRNGSFPPIADATTHCDTRHMLPLRTARMLLVTFALAACTSINLSGSDAQQVLRTDEERRIAQLNSNIAVLDRIIADDATLIYGDGTTETKSSLLAQIRAGSLRWTKSEYEPPQVRMYGDVGIVTGRARSSTNNGPVHVVYVTRVYARRHGAWRLVASQTTRMAGSP